MDNPESNPDPDSKLWLQPNPDPEERKKIGSTTLELVLRGRPVSSFRPIFCMPSYSKKAK